MEERIVKPGEDFSDEVAQMSAGGQLEFVAVKKPRGIVIRKYKNGTVKIRIEMTQAQLDAEIEAGLKAHEKEKEGKP
jgi:hypothetical protein